jgi:hypothetical protein
MKRINLIVAFFISSITCAHAEPQYVLIKQSWWYGYKMIHVDKPKKKLHKWYYDSQNDTYYRMKTAFGFGIPLFKGTQK